MKPCNSLMARFYFSDLPNLCAYLESSQVECRVAAGETLALLYELGREASPDFRPDNHQHTIDVLAALATDSLKYHAKRDRRTQRASFRQIYAAINVSLCALNRLSCLDSLRVV